MKKVFVILVSVLLLSAFLLLPASADSGPKPSIRITLKNAGDGLCYGTLLSKKPYSGPFVAWEGDENTIRQDQTGVPEQVWRAFMNYEDADGYYYLQNTIREVESGELSWGYHPPENFKLLLYFPESGSFAVSGVCERYAFDSYFTVDVAGIGAGGNTQLTLRRTYQWYHEALSLIARIVITVAVEILIALLFRFRDKKSLLFILVVNIVTQILLNVALNVIDLNFGRFGFIFGYFLLEFLVFAVEAVIYSIFLRKLPEKERSTGICVVYALAANAASFLIGMGISLIIPGIF
jgi:hypothetical protein